jgi:AbrB family looped-hinge helix DNA binding protein
MREELVIRVSRVSEKGVVQIPLEIRQKLDLKPGTKLILVATEDAVVLQKMGILAASERRSSMVQRIRSIFSKVQIRNMEE